MTDRTPKKLNDSFNPASETDRLLREIRDLAQVVKEGAAQAKTPLVELPMVSDLKILEVCLRTVKNQQQLEQEIAALKKRLEDLEGGGPTLRLDKGPKL